MKIEKRKVTEAKPLSVAAKSAMGVMLGMTTAATFIACGGPVGEISDAIDENSSSSNEIQAPKSDSSSPESSNQAETQQSSSEQSEAQQNSAEQTGAQQSGQEQTETKQSSSSQVVVDIPLSHEPISSSVMEALSAAAESSSSSTPPTNSSSSHIKFGDGPETDTTCPPMFPSTDPCKCVPDGTTVEYQTEFGVQLITCPQPNSSQNMDGFSFSMVTTFERTDVEA
ncbi:MAG: hypothetical protein J6W54_09905 [Fibrobacter sp.]|uniref:hypothetical protein n=1 Tax=Fibrobacter sp. TaxID=35828 RepID=UPI001AFF153D|nr:hypothetical protein [Fibrobacter sp.]MBO7061387.1 hypothetical protein [Fibrobacter sp.]